MRRLSSICLIIVVWMALLVSGCGEGGCSLNKISLVRFDFHDSKTDKPVKLVNPVIVTGHITATDTVSGARVNLVDTLFNRADAFMTLPMSYTDRTTYVMHYTETQSDTIDLHYEAKPYVKDIACSPIVKFTIDDYRYTTHRIDSVKLLNHTVDENEKVNFVIYYTVQ